MFGEYILAIASDNVRNNLSPGCFVTRKSKMLDRCTSLQFLVSDKINCLPVTFQESHGELKWFQNNVSSHKHWDAIKTEKSYSEFTLLTQSGRVALNRSVCTLVTSSTLPVHILTVWLHTYKLHQIEKSKTRRELFHLEISARKSKASRTGSTERTYMRLKK